MRHDADWMTVWDDRLLEWLYHADAPGSVTGIAQDDRIRITAQQVARRLERLAEGGLVAEAEEGVYAITAEGAGYLAEEYDVSAGAWRGEAADTA